MYGAGYTFQKPPVKGDVAKRLFQLTVVSNIAFCFSFQYRQDFNTQNLCNLPNSEIMCVRITLNKQR
jgi:hypothetical protein